MRGFAVVVAAFILGAQAPPPKQSPADFEDFDRALASFDFERSGQIIDQLIIERTPADGKPKPDPLLNALIGRMLLAAQKETGALPYLEAADIGQLPASLRVSTALAHARSLELMGYREKALAAYRSAEAFAGAGSPERRQAILGSARQRIVTEPAAVRQELMSLPATGEPGDRWHAEYLVAAASSLLGDRTTAAQFSDRAWADSGRAPAADLAPLTVAVLKAGLAAAGGDRTGELSMLAAANAMAVTRGNDLVRQLPVCGDDGIKPSDFVIFGAFAGPYNGKGLIPIAASRAAIVRPFYDRLVIGSRILKPDSLSTAAGTVFTASCVSKVDPAYVSDRLPADPLAEWLVAKGLNPATMRNESDNEGINRISDRIESLEQRFGRDSALLIPARWQLLAVLEAKGLAGDDVSSGRMAELRTALVDGLRRNGAPEWLAQSIEIRGDMDRLARRAMQGDSDIAALQALWKHFVSQLPFRYARLMIAEGLEQVGEQMEGQQARTITDLNSRIPPDYGGRDREAWLVTVSSAQRALGLDAQARSTIASLKLPGDICTAVEKPPVMLEQNFTSGDYPNRLIPAELKGYAYYEFEITEAGGTELPRPVLTFPSGLFDEATTKGLETMRFTPATRDGKARRCRGYSQGVTWRLEEESDFAVPSLLPQSDGADRT